MLNAMDATTYASHHTVYNNNKPHNTVRIRPRKAEFSLQSWVKALTLYPWYG